MKLDNMFKKTRYTPLKRSERKADIARPEVPEGLLKKCNKCGAAIIAEDVKRDAYIDVRRLLQDACIPQD